MTALFLNKIEIGYQACAAKFVQEAAIVAGVSKRPTKSSAPDAAARMCIHAHRAYFGHPWPKSAV